MPNAVACPKTAKKSNKHLDNLLIEFLGKGYHIACQHEERDDHNSDIGHPERRSASESSPECSITLVM